MLCPRKEENATRHVGQDQSPSKLQKAAIMKFGASQEPNSSAGQLFEEENIKILVRPRSEVGTKKDTCNPARSVSTDCRTCARRAERGGRSRGFFPVPLRERRHHAGHKQPGTSVDGIGLACGNAGYQVLGCLLCCQIRAEMTV
jgi:hypothetical protein